MVQSKSSDIFCVSDIWLSSNVSDREILPPGYSIYRNDRGSRCGGVMVVVSSHIPSKCIQVQASCKLIIINLSLHVHPNTFICCTYVPPSSPSSYYEDIAQALHLLPSSSHPILLGDLNITEVNWSTFDSPSPSLSLSCDHLFPLNMLQIVNTPTHIQGNVLDLIFSNYPNLFTNLTVVPSYSVSHLISIHLLNSCPPVNQPPPPILCGTTPKLILKVFNLIYLIEILMPASSLKM